MPSWQRAYATSCAAIVAGALAYVLCDFGAWPRLMYMPYDDVWIWRRTAPDPAAMAYLGMVLWGTLGAALGGGAAWIGLGRRREALGDTALSLAGGWAMSAAGFAAIYFVWGLWPF